MSKASKKSPEKKSTVEFINVEQNSPEWVAARVGVITASNFGKVMTGGEGKTRARYMRQLAGEIITGIPAETFQSQAMNRGKEMEAEAIAQYERTRFDVTKVGFVKNTGLLKYGVVGASPDRLVGSDGGLEVKTMIPELMIEVLEKGAAGFPNEHRAQVQGGMWVCERQWWTLKIFYSGMPKCEFFVERDDAYIKRMADEIEIFNFDLSKMVERLRNMGAK